MDNNRTKPVFSCITCNYAYCFSQLEWGITELTVYFNYSKYHTDRPPHF